MREAGRESRVTLSDGAKTTLEIWGERGPLLLCIHGMTGSRRSWLRLTEYLDGRCRIAAYDQRGHGDSSGVGGPMTLAQSVGDLAAVAAAVGEPIRMAIGHSWGGAVAILGGAHLPVGNVVAIDPMLRQCSSDWYEEFVDELRQLLALSPEERSQRIRRENPTWSDLDVAGKTHALQTLTIDPILRLRDENPPATWDVLPTIASYAKPLLLFMATPSESISDAALQQRVSSERSPTVEMLTLEGGHSLHRNAFDRFATAFLARSEGVFSTGDSLYNR